MALRVFPVAGNTSFADEFGGRGGAHQGVDIFAPEGTPVRAVDDGRVEHATDPKGGTVAMLHSTDGTRYYYAHLSRYEGIAGKVRAGDVIAYVGNTGNAAATKPHVHFEMHPGEGPAVDPYPALKATLAPLAPLPSSAPVRRPPELPIWLLVLGLVWLSKQRR
jgi:murein DD-endopeptidase MepM/ murein hydrolase activator NlpD